MNFKLTQQNKTKRKKIFENSNTKKRNSNLWTGEVSLYS